MHDLKFAQEIIAVTKQMIASYPGNKLQGKMVTVEVLLSRLSHVKPEQLIQTYTMISREAGLENTRLDIKPLPYELTCRKCGTSSHNIDPVFSCAKCGSSDFDITIGRECQVEKIAIED